MGAARNGNGHPPATDRGPEPPRTGPVGLITGSGTYALPIDDPSPWHVETDYGAAELTAGWLGGVEVLHLSRHGDGHPRLSHQVTHRANIAALAQMEARCVIATTICGAVDPRLALGDLVVFDDFHFPSNRLPDGSACTFHVAPGDPARAHWIFDRPYSPELRAALVGAAAEAGRGAHAGGCYGHVDGPRFNTAAEIRALRHVGVTAVSQTAGPEAVLAGEAGIPYALLGYLTDWANGAGPRATTVPELVANMVASVAVFCDVIARAVRLAAAAAPRAPGERYGFERDRAPYSARV